MTSPDAQPTPRTPLKEGLEWAWKAADDLDSNHARWIISKLAEQLGVDITFPPVNEPNNRLREQLAEAQAALAEREAADALDPELLARAMRTSHALRWAAPMNDTYESMASKIATEYTQLRSEGTPDR